MDRGSRYRRARQRLILIGAALTSLYCANLHQAGVEGLTVDTSPLGAVIVGLTIVGLLLLGDRLQRWRLKEQIELLHIEINEAKRNRQAAEITETGYFQRLRGKARGMRGEGGPSPGERGES